AFIRSGFFGGSRHPEANTRSYFSLIFLRECQSSPDEGQCGEGAYRIAGGVPEGMKFIPGVSGCRTRRNKTSIRTVTGKSRTTPKGIVTVELPRSRMRRRRKATRGERYCCCENSSNCCFV